MRLLTMFFLAMLSTPGISQQREVAPLVSKYDYGEVRCNAYQFGYPNEAAAVNGGVLRNYGPAEYCPWSTSPQNSWGSEEEPSPGACGGTSLYPYYTLGVESINTRQYFVDYMYGDSCQHEARDGLSIYRARTVTCPAGYTPSNNKCVRAVGALDPGKNNNTCLVGENGSNPIHSALGTKLQREQDLDLGGGLRFTRFYSSASHWGETAMGRQWRHNLDATVLLADAAPSGGPATAWVQRPNGDLFSFNRVTATTWASELDVSLQLSPVYSGNTISAWSLRDHHGHIESYDQDGRLTAIENPNERLSLGYDGQGRLQRLTDMRGRSLTFDYDASNRIRGIVGPAGELYQYEYDGSGNLSSVTLPAAAGAPVAQRAYLYEEPSFPNALTGIVDESGDRYATWAYDTEGRAALSVHGAINSPVDRVSLTYNTDGTTTVVDALQATRTFGFVESHGVKRFANVTEPCALCGGNASRERTYVNGFVDVETDFAGTTTDYDYNANGLIAQKIESANKPTVRRTTQTDWHPTLAVPTERRTYDSANALVTKSSWTHNTRGQALTQTQTDPVLGLSRITTTTYCEQADITAGTCPLLGLVKSVNGPRTDVSDLTTFSYRMADEASCVTSPTTCPYRKGDLWKVTNALSQVAETLKYDGAGRVLAAKDANGVVTDLEYHPRGWLTARKLRGANGASEADDQITRIEYWPTGLVKKVTQPDGAFTAYIYDAAHRLTDIADNEGNTIHYALDNAGNRTGEGTKDEQGTLLRTLSRVYNQLGQLATQADADLNPTDFTYDANGNADTVTDALTRVTDNDYDPLNRLQRTLQDFGGIEAETKFEYDAQDNLTKVTDPKGLNTTYGYNGLGDLLQLSSPDTGITTYTYDSGGNRKTQVDARNKTTTYGYDALNRLSGITYPTTSLNVTYTYDTTQAVCPTGETFSKGRLTKIADASGTTQYCYDRFGQLVRKHQVTNGVALVVRYSYTPAGRLQSLTYPDGQIAIYSRDGQGRTTGVSVAIAGGECQQVLVSGVQYAPFGPATAWMFGDGSGSGSSMGRQPAGPEGESLCIYPPTASRGFARTLNLNYQSAAIADASIGGLSLGYEFDPVGNLAKLRTAQQTDPPLATYTYDALNRLSDTKDGPTGTVIEHYAYDATGNRLSLTHPAGVTTPYTYPATSHRLDSVGATARSYDAAGNTTQIGGTARQFVYDDTGRMSQVKAGSTVTMQYTYNGKGEQVRRYLNTVNTYAVYDEAGHWLGDYSNTGVPIQQAVWMDDLPVGLMASNGLNYVEADALGTPRVVIDPVRDVAIWRWDLTGEAFGNTAPNQNPDGDANQFVFNMRFPGQRFDQTSGLNYNYLRDGYEATSGRYTQPDPIGLVGGPSVYGYVRGNSLRFTDRLGLQSQGQPGMFDPGPWPQDPMTAGTRDPRTPWLPPAATEPRKYCAPYYRADTNHPNVGLALVPLAKEDPPQGGGCKFTVTCHYRGIVAVNVFQGSKQADLGTTEFELELELTNKDCSCGGE